jgi:glycerate dehydrogenase
MAVGDAVIARKDSPLGDRLKKIVFLDRDTLSMGTHLRPLSFRHEMKAYPSTRDDEISGRIAEADIVITNKVPLKAEVLDHAKRLTIVAVAATGTDAIDIAECEKRGILVTNIRDYAVNTVPEHTLALILALRRRIVAYHNANVRGRWSEARQFCYFDFPIRDLVGSTIGIVGDGNLGRAVAKLAGALGLNILFSDYKGSSGMGPLYTPFDEVMRRSDIITLHCPLMATTRNLIGKREFSLMERRPLLINTARGGLVDETALADALIAGTIGGAAFDVVTQEPPAKSHPFAQLMERSDFILTPHVAWASEEAMQSLADQLIDNIEAAVAGAPRNVITAGA